MGVQRSRLPSEEFAEVCPDYNNWPNSVGFDGSDVATKSYELAVVGDIPTYCHGTLYRTGPQSDRLRKANGQQMTVHHWFDGFSQLYAFQILPQENRDGTPVRVLYSSRSTTGFDNASAPSMESSCTFGQSRDPCESFFAKISTTFTMLYNMDPSRPTSPNIGVSLLYHSPSQSAFGINDSRASPAAKLTATTDANGILFLDPETLEVKGSGTQSTLHHSSLVGPVTGTHYCTDPVTGDMFNYNIDCRATSIYRIFSVSASTGQSDILATITDAPPAYIHSFFLTEHFVVLCVWGAHFSWRGLKILWNQNVIDSLDPLDPSKDCLWYVVDRTPLRRGVVACYTSPAFFAFHAVNAYEERSDATDQTHVILDVACYDDLSVLKHYYYENLRSASLSAHKFAKAAHAPRARLARFRLPNVLDTKLSMASIYPTPDGTKRRAEMLWKVHSDISLELPSVHPKFVTKQHRYIYGVTNRGKSTFFDGLGKFDCETKTVIVWEKHAHTPSEPIFVPDPNAPEGDEDAGVILTVVLDGHKGTSYLLVLDAKTMLEVGRAESDSAIAFGFHGLHVPQTEQSVKT